MKTIKIFIIVALILTLITTIQTSAWLLIPVMGILLILLISIFLFIKEDTKNNRPEHANYKHKSSSTEEAIDIVQEEVINKANDIFTELSQNGGSTLSQGVEAIENSNLTRRELSYLIVRERRKQGCGDPNCLVCSKKSGDMPDFIKALIKDLEDMPGVSVVAKKSLNDDIPPITGPSGEA